MAVRKKFASMPEVVTKEMQPPKANPRRKFAADRFAPARERITKRALLELQAAFWRLGVEPPPIYERGREEIEGVLRECLLELENEVNGFYRDKLGQHDTAPEPEPQPEPQPEPD